MGNSTITNWIIKNKEWVFGGAGLTVLGGIVWLFRKSREYWDHKKKREDLVFFLQNLLKNDMPLTFESINKNLNNILSSCENEIGAYRLGKLFLPLKEMKILSIKRTHNGGYLASVFPSVTYSEQDIKYIISDVKRGAYDKFLQ